MGDSGTMTRASLAEVLHAEIGLSRSECATLIDDVLERIGSALEGGDNVKISGFGSFLLRDKNARVGRNPKTGVEVPISPRRVLTFRPSQKMRERITRG